jgi:hypothetical protein
MQAELPNQHASAHLPTLRLRVEDMEKKTGRQKERRGKKERKTEDVRG